MHLQHSNQQFNNFWINPNSNVNISTAANQRHSMSSMERISSQNSSTNSSIHRLDLNNSIDNYYLVPNNSMVNSNSIQAAQSPIYSNQMNSSSVNQMNSSVVNRMSNNEQQYSIDVKVNNSIKPTINYSNQIMINSQPTNGHVKNNLNQQNISSPQMPQMLFNQTNGLSTNQSMRSNNYQRSISGVQNVALNNQNCPPQIYFESNQSNYQNSTSSNVSNSSFNYCSPTIAGTQMNDEQIKDHFNNDYHSRTSSLLNQAAENLTKFGQVFSSQCDSRMILDRSSQRINDQLNASTNGMSNELNRLRLTNNQYIVPKNQVCLDQSSPPNSISISCSISNSIPKFIPNGMNSVAQQSNSINSILQDSSSPILESLPIKKERFCANCNVNQSTLWRKKDNGDSLCNACGLYFKVHKVDRPIKMHKRPIHKRKRKQQKININNLMTGELINNLMYCNLTSVQMPFGVIESSSISSSVPPNSNTASNSIIFNLTCVQPNDTRVSNKSINVAAEKQVDVQDLNEDTLDQLS